MTGKEIKNARWVSRLSQTELAELAGISRTTLWKAERDQNISEKNMYMIETTLKELRENV